MLLAFARVEGGWTAVQVTGLVLFAIASLMLVGLNVPALVTIILCYVWFGLNDTAAIVAVAINKIPTVIVTVREGARAVV